MRRLGLDPAAEQRAITAFNQGKNGDDDLRRSLQRLSRQRAEAQSLLLSCWRLVLSAGAAQPAERELIQQWGKWAGWSLAEVEALTIGMHRPAAGPPRATDGDYRAALSLLGVTPGSDPATIKSAYRRLLSRSHPDKRAGAGATAAQVREATESTQRLRSAYALVRERHGFR
jgi:DnaJ like chaperone protein